VQIAFRAAIVVLIASGASARADSPGVLPNTAPLTLKTDFAADMVAGIDRYLERELAASVHRRQALWAPDYSSPEAYTRSVAPNREHFARIIGAVDARVRTAGGEDWAMPVADAPDYTIKAVRWPVFDRVETEGLLLEPKVQAFAAVVAVPDADQTPEMLVGLAGGLEPATQYARRLAENGCRVYVPTLIDRGCAWSGNPRLRMTNQTHREWIYRMSFEVGRHIIGYEVQRVLAAVDRLSQMSASGDPAGRVPVGVMGWGEGGLIAFYAAALDSRIEAAVVSGYFRSRQEVWTEPVYRNVWALLHEFGDAEIAGLIAPRTLVIEAGRGLEIEGPPTLEGHAEAAPGKLITPPIECVRFEFKRARAMFEKLAAAEQLHLIEPGEQAGPGTDAAVTVFMQSLGADATLNPSGGMPADLRGNYDREPRLRRQFDQLVGHTQRLLEESHHARAAFWAKADKTSPTAWAESCRWYREYFHEEVIGACEPANVFPDPRTRKILDEPKFTGYEVMLDVWPDVFAYGVLLLPKDVQPGERRPVVVCQHGLEGRPEVVVDPRITGLYNSFGARLADRGFVVFAPQNPYIGGNDFRILQRKANPLKKSLFSVITGQHERILEWLANQPFVDGKRMGFYGISYGGKTAMRVPALLPQYALSICSADFNEYARKVASTDYRNGFLFVQEYEIPEFDFANTFNHAELAGLIAPRPFMVERGHGDAVAPDEWVGFEYAKVRRLYAELGIPDRTEIEFFAGGHEIHAVGTFQFLHRWLRWPGP
jgi:dienelactone hydrolase